MSGNLSSLALGASPGPAINVPVHTGPDISGSDEVSGSAYTRM